MTKVYPNAATRTASSSSSCVLSSEKAPYSITTTDHDHHGDGEGVVQQLTVWKKSLLPNCSGFTVFDNHGNLVFRVDNYIARNNHEILLMDAAGTALLTIRRKRLSLGDNWLVFEGEGASAKPLFTARKHVNILNTKCLAHLLINSSSGNEEDDHSDKKKKKKKEVAYEIEGSYAQRCCTVYDNKRRIVAEIKRKEAAVVAGSGGGGARVATFGADVFRLIVQPDMDPTLAMAFVILLDLMFR